MCECGWLWTDGHIVGDLSSWRTEYGWNGKTYPTRDQAIHAGLRDYGSDDFNIAHIESGIVDWWGWMDEPHELNDASEFASQYVFFIKEVVS